MATPLPSCVLVLAVFCGGCHMGIVGGLAGMAAASSSNDGLYRAGTIGQELGDTSVRTVGCLDVGLVLVDRAYARDPGTSLLQLHIGNRCSHPEAFDFGKIRIEGTAATGESRVVRLEDPRHEIVELHVGAGERGKELVRLSSSAGLVRLAIDMTAVAPDAPHAHPAQLHFARESTAAPWTAVDL